MVLHKVNCHFIFRIIAQYLKLRLNTFWGQKLKLSLAPLKMPFLKLPKLAFPPIIRRRAKTFGQGNPHLLLFVCATTSPLLLCNSVAEHVDGQSSYSVTSFVSVFKLPDMRKLKEKRKRLHCLKKESASLTLSQGCQPGQESQPLHRTASRPRPGQRPTWRNLH